MSYGSIVIHTYTLNVCAHFPFIKPGTKQQEARVRLRASTPLFQRFTQQYSNVRTTLIKPIQFTRLSDTLVYPTHSIYCIRDFNW